MQKADTAAQSQAVQGRLAELAQSEGLLHSLLERQACFSRAQLAVKGGDLAACGLHGPEIGRALELLLDAVMDGRCANNREALLLYWTEYGGKENTSIQNETQEERQNG